MKGADPEVEAVEHRVADKQNANQQKPDRIQVKRHAAPSCHLGNLSRSCLYLVIEKIEKQHAQEQIDQGEENQRGPDLAGGDDLRDAVAGAQKTVDDPRLPPDLRRNQPS